ncbi:two-component response regulator-like PRR95 [Iris pallida]|uniref:Two-component response regulator-like PRR95 n=1 Tax=Iris pallida TaxID=29817 RepID=A0AAX6H876_IRIPA|nr:two-component response regulator-like PRR95 [Iris pallida]
MGWPRRMLEEETEEVVEVAAAEEVEEVAGSHEVVRWESFLRRGSSLRVLLVEGDDSTRQIIAALLRKCNYKVAAVSDGWKAWEILKEKPQGIDLVLTEVELPSVSGLSLLTMITDHETCKNIPVIMMSSHDSINMVYKYMLKGAADFLVKPIRRNELRNLWQHVWRRQSMTDGHAGKSFHQDGNLGKRKHDFMSEKEENISGYAACTKKNKECSKKGSDAESSCTRSDMEAESTYKLNQQEHKQTTFTSFSSTQGSSRQNDEDQIMLNDSLPVHEGQTEGKATALSLEAKPSSGKCMSNKRLIDEERSCALVETTNEGLKPTESVDNNIAIDTEEQNSCQDTPLKEAINLIGLMEYQPENGYGIRNYIADERSLSKNMKIFNDKDAVCRSSPPMPHLELSLRRYQYSSFEEERGECGALNHSGSSAFSQYSSRTALPTTLTRTTSPADGEECFGTSTRVVPDQGSGSSSGAPRWYGAPPSMNIEEVMPAGVPAQNGKAIKCSPLRVVPLPIPARGTNLDSSSSGHGPLTIPMFYQQSSANSLWNNIPPTWQQVDNKDTSHQRDVKDVNSFRSHQADDQSQSSHNLHADQTQEANLELRDEQIHLSSVGDSGSSNICNGTTNHLNNSEGGNFCNTNTGASAEVENEVKKLADIYRTSQREAALNKFRMKRKDRCFEKKVRYQSRKKLAEQRPRVKGQFVRHVQPDPCSTEVLTRAKS